MIESHERALRSMGERHAAVSRLMIGRALRRVRGDSLAGVAAVDLNKVGFVGLARVLSLMMKAERETLANRVEWTRWREDRPAGPDPDPADWTASETLRAEVSAWLNESGTDLTA